MFLRINQKCTSMLMFPCVGEKAFECIKTGWWKFFCSRWEKYSEDFLHTSCRPSLDTARVLEGLPRPFSSEKPQQDAFSMFFNEFPVFFFSSKSILDARCVGP